MATPDRVVIVVADPDETVQSGFTRLLSDTADIVCFSESEAALKYLQTKPAVAVVVSCFNLPGRGGVAFLRACEGIAPLAARVMLTRETSAQVLKRILNEGRAFFYLEKPCPKAELMSAMETAMTHHHHLARERAILERTLAGSVKMLIDMLALFHPEAFRRTGIVRKQALKLAGLLGLQKTWELEMAVMLSPLGEALLPKDILARYRTARSLNDQEREILNKAPEQTRELLKNIPQLEKVAEYLYLSARGYDGSGFPRNGPAGNDIPLVSRILKLLTDLWYASPEGGPDPAAFEALLVNWRQYDPRLLDMAKVVLLDDIAEDRKQFVTQCHIRTLNPGDVLIDDVLTETTRELVLARGHRLTPTTIRRLEHYNQTAGVRQPIRVERHDGSEAALEETA